MESHFHKPGDVVDHTPGAAVTGGQVLNVHGAAAIAINDIAANAAGTLYRKGIFDIQAAAVVGNIDNVVGWDEDGDPVNGTAGTGAVTTDLSVADFILGSLTVALASGDGRAFVRLNEFAADQPAFRDWTHELKADNYTVDALDQNKVLHIATDAKAFTLPDTTTVGGMEVVFVNDGADGDVLLSISPNAGDKIMGPDIAGTDNKDQLNTKTTAIQGDYMHLKADGINGWYIKASRGIWAEEG